MQEEVMQEEMVSEPKKVQIKMPHSTTIHYVVTATGETGAMPSIQGRLTLTRGRMYKVPVNTEENLDNFTIFKTTGKLNELFDVRNIENGIATINPIVHNTVLRDGDILGVFI